MPLFFRCYIFFCECKRLSKLNVNTNRRASLPHKTLLLKRLVPPLILWLFDITLCHTFASKCLAASLAHMNSFSTVALLLLELLAQACKSWQIRACWVLGGVMLWIWFDDLKFSLYFKHITPLQLLHGIFSVVINEYPNWITLFKCLRLQSHGLYVGFFCLFFFGGWKYILFVKICHCFYLFDLWKYYSLIVIMFCCTLLKLGLLLKLKLFLCCWIVMVGLLPMPDVFIAQRFWRHRARFLSASRRFVSGVLQLTALWLV